MQWFDWMSLGIVVGVAIIQTVRGVKAGGLGLPMYEAAGLIVAAVGATKLSGPLGESLHVRAGTTMIVLFLVFGVLALVLGRWLFSLTGTSFQSMDGFFSFIFGIVAGWTIAHMVLRIIIESQGTNGAVASMAATSPVVREVYLFHTWNKILSLLFRAKLGPEFNPDVG
ncbi:MAG: hypothetical protein ABIK86_06950 [candidate division WOR-3 bacterium]